MEEDKAKVFRKEPTKIKSSNHPLMKTSLKIFSYPDPSNCREKLGIEA